MSIVKKWKSRVLTSSGVSYVFLVYPDKNADYIILVVPFAIVFTESKIRHKSRKGPMIWISQDG